MNIITIPFHDMRKNQKEGFRNRDSHFIQKFSTHGKVNKLLIINRPITLAECFYKRVSWKTNGKYVVGGWNFQLTEQEEGVYSLDYLILFNISILFQKKMWFFKAYSKSGFQKIVNYSLTFLNIKEYYSIIHTPYAYNLVKHLNSKVAVFDADDNWLMFPKYQNMKTLLEMAYSSLAIEADHWITNSLDNLKFFRNEFKVKNCELVQNGVDVEVFKKKYVRPEILSEFNKPIIGFGGSITHLIDTNLFNFIVEENPHLDFVIIGPVNDKGVFNRLKFTDNFHYLGDIKYDQYPQLITHFDVCIIPYFIGDKAHGGDSLKFYEFLAAGKKVVSTNGNGIRRLNNNIFIAESENEFSKFINVALNQEQTIYEVPEQMSWSFKADLIIKNYYFNK